MPDWVWGFESPLSHEYLPFYIKRKVRIETFRQGYRDVHLRLFILKQKENFLDVTVTEKENCRREIRVKLPNERVAPKIDEAYREYQKNVKLQGFRKGKVPMNLVKKMFGKEIESKVAEDLIAEVYSEIIEEHKLKPIAPGSMDKIKFDPKEGLDVIIVMDVEPEIEDIKYKNLTIDRPVYEVTDAHVDMTLERLREEHAMISNVQDPAEVGHILQVDIQQLDRTGVPILNQKMEDRYLELREEAGTPKEYSLVSQLVGVKSGEQRRVRVMTEKKPQNPNEQPSQEEEFYEIAVKNVQKKELPDVDDELAKDIGNFESLEDLKAQIRTSLETQNAQTAQKEFRDAMIDEVIKSNSVEAPEIMVERYLNLLVSYASENGKRKIDEQEVKKQYRADAIRNVKWELLQSKIAEQEKISVTDDDADIYIENIIKQAKESGRKVDESINSENSRRRIKNQLFEERILETVAQNAKINEKKITPESEEKSKIISTT